MPDGFKDRGALRAHLLEGKTNQDGCQEGGQDGNVAGDDAQQEVHRAVGGSLLVGIVGRQLEAFARVDQVAHHQANGERERGHDHEVAQCQAPHFADCCGFGDRADAQDDGAEDDGGNHHLDELDEAVAKRLQRFADLREQQADYGAQDYGGDDGHVKVVGFVEALAGGLRRRC